MNLFFVSAAASSALCPLGRCSGNLYETGTICPLVNLTSLQQLPPNPLTLLKSLLGVPSLIPSPSVVPSPSHSPLSWVVLSKWVVLREMRVGRAQPSPGGWSGPFPHLSSLRTFPKWEDPPPKLSEKPLRGSEAEILEGSLGEGYRGEIIVWQPFLRLRNLSWLKLSTTVFWMGWSVLIGCLLFLQ